ncbi:uncharacterized protein VDAG_09130 [Verticillium dahliae VdLs.17]|uniref:Kelch repeat protein n=1 Tax=Verticillium dahliae (strain VdLs.17 / ATCC MYA-4575 / FGSC 10137) TaxID=498257 RepID=G2XFK6_VERDV|nr:uncharacterized protein VDAG_09130 [Verticillium dahliae VdLs.17]EGY18604.1 hypothetical protein VDAG_09130 [Verticillium dahliae VdLs.17]
MSENCPSSVQPMSALYCSSNRRVQKDGTLTQPGPGSPCLVSSSVGSSFAWPSSPKRMCGMAMGICRTPRLPVAVGAQIRTAHLHWLPAPGVVTRSIWRRKMGWTLAVQKSSCRTCFVPNIGNSLPAMVRMLAICFVAAFSRVVFENPLGLMYTLNFSQPFQSSDNFTALFGTISKARGGVGNTNNDAPNYYDGAMLVNSAQLSLYGGLVKKTDAYQPPRADDALTYQAYQYGPVRNQFEAGFVSNTLPSGMTRYVAYGGAVSAPSENMAWYFGGLRAPDWGPVFQRNTNVSQNALNTSNTLLTLDMATQTTLEWTNNTLPDGIRSRANPEVVWVPVGEQGILVVVGGVTYPDWLTSARKSENPTQSKAESDEFMSTVDIYDIANNTWYRQATSDGPTARARACAVVAPAQDQSSFNIYIYGGYPGVDPKVEMNDEIWVLSLPSFTWTRLSDGRPGRGRNGHKCFMPYPDQMMVIGGMTSEAGDHLTCLPDLIQVYNLTSGHWMESYDPERHADYGVPAAVREVIGGGAAGGAILTAPSPLGWSDDGLANVFAVSYPTSKIQTWYPYSRATEADRPRFTPGSDGRDSTDDSGGGGGMPRWIGPTLGVTLGLVCVTAFLGSVCLWRRRKIRRRGTHTEYNGNRILSWIRGQPTEEKTRTVTTEVDTPSNPDVPVAQEPTSSPIPTPLAMPHSEMMGTPFAELHGDSYTLQFSNSRLTSTAQIPQDPLSFPTQPTYYYGSVSDKEILSPSDSSGVLGPYNLAESPAHGVASPVDTIVGMRDRVWPTVSSISNHDTGHLRQISEATVSSASDAENYSSVPLVVSPFDKSATNGPPLVPIPIRPTIVSPAPEKIYDHQLSPQHHHQ